jgi:hypothetical protein
MLIINRKNNAIVLIYIYQRHLTTASIPVNSTKEILVPF